MPSTCVLGAPRLKSSAQKEFNLARLIAFATHPDINAKTELGKMVQSEQKYTEYVTIRHQFVIFVIRIYMEKKKSCNVKRRDDTKRMRNSQKSHRTIRKLTERLKQASSAESTRKQLKRTALENNYVSSFTVPSAIPSSVANPEPEPVTVAPLEELEPLFAHLRNKYPVSQQISFARGYVYQNDLTKQRDS
jgi:hypothetical protein